MANPSGCLDLTRDTRTKRWIFAPALEACSLSYHARPEYSHVVALFVEEERARVFFRSTLGVWMLAAFVVAVRQALDYTSTGRAVGVCLIGWIVNAAILFFLGFVLLR